jgi:DNA-binding transcriptional ArsR family regulator
VETYEAVLEALGDSTRRQILQRLRAGPAAVNELAAAVPVSRPAVSQHLRVLHQTGLVRYDDIGTRNVYRLDPSGIAPLRDWLDDFWQTALDSFAAYARRDTDEREADKRDADERGVRQHSAGQSDAHTSTATGKDAQS